MTNITDVITQDNYMTTFLRALKVAGLEGVLSAKGPFTVFVPTNLAFGKLLTGVLEEWSGDSHMSELRAVLNRHITMGKTSFAELTEGVKLNTVDGQQLFVSITSKAVNINNAEIWGRDMEASNGVVHSIDRVILNT